MKLQINTAGSHRPITAEDERALSETLGANGIRLNLACGGNNRCGRCRIRLLAGKFRISGVAYDADRQGPCDANACRVYPAGAEGAIEVPAASLQQAAEQVETSFHLSPDTQLPVQSGITLAFDIGTTTVAAALVKNGVAVKTAGQPNAQARFGDNVIDRIVAAGRSPEALQALRRVLVTETLDPLIAELTPEPGTIRRIAVAGNTVMSHIFYGLSPESIGVAPFRPQQLRFPEQPAKEFGFTGVAANTPVTLWPALSGNIGGDVLGGMYVTGFGRDATRTELLLDLGTNCEMVLHDRGRLRIASAAAGPAFEGSSSSVGCRAHTGAVDHLSISESGHIQLHVIGGDLRQLNGICGSGLVDFLAEMRKTGLLDSFGRYDRVRLAALGKLEAGTSGSGAQCRLSSRLAVSEADIEALLKAKAAIEAGTLALLQSAGKRPDELDAIYLCGGFASALKLESAQAIGLLPAIPHNRIQICGNTALAAAVIASAAPSVIDQCDPEQLDYTEVSLNHLDFFAPLYTNSLMLE